MPSLLAHNIQSQEIRTNAHFSKLMKLKLRCEDSKPILMYMQMYIKHSETKYSNGWTLAQGQHTCRQADSNTFSLFPAPTQACHQECQLALIRRRCAGSRQLQYARLLQPPSFPTTGQAVLLSFPHKVEPRRCFKEGDVRPAVWTWEETRQVYQGQVFFPLKTYIWRLLER